MNINAAEFGGSYTPPKNEPNKLNDILNKGKQTFYTINKGTEELGDLIFNGNDKNKDYKELEDLANLTVDFLSFMLEEDSTTEQEEPKKSVKDVLADSLTEIFTAAITKKFQN